MGNSRFFASADFFDQERNSKSGIGAFSTTLPGDYLDAFAKPKSVFSLRVLGASLAEVCMFDKVGGKQLGSWMVGLPKELNEIGLVSWLLVARDDQFAPRVDVWARGNDRTVYCVSINPLESATNTQDFVPLRLIAIFREQIEFTTCNSFGDCIVSSPAGLLVIPSESR
jgi:hypothetical protein